MNVTFSINQFRWSDTARIVTFLNKLSCAETTETELSERLFRQWHEMPGENPELDCFIAETARGEVLGFLHMITEKPIRRSIAIQSVAQCTDHSAIAKQFALTARKFAGDQPTDVLHIQINKEDHEWRMALEDTGWTSVKEYWNLRWKSENRHLLEKVSIPEGFGIRKLELDTDIKIFTEIQNESFSEHWGFCPNTVEEITARILMERSGEEGILLVHEGTRIAGYNWTLYASNGSAAIGWVGMTGVHPDYRGKKLGKAIVLTGMHKLFERGANRIELEVDSENVPARELYYKLGFEKVSETLWFESPLQ